MKHTSDPHSRFEHINPDEIEQLIAPSIVLETDSKTMLNGHDKTGTKLLDSDINVDEFQHKLGADTFAGASMIIIGTTMYGIFGILSRLSMLGNKSTMYQSAAAMVVAEFGKFIVSILLLFNNQGIEKCINSLKSIQINECLLFSIPALLYSITNNLSFYILQYMDPGSMQVLVETKVITTSILWWWFFKILMDKQEWISLILLCTGAVFVAWPWPDINNMKNTDLNENNILHSMYVEWPIGPSLVAIQVCLSAIAYVYTEWIYKRYGRNRSTYMDNLSMYFWGVLSNGAQFVYMNKDKDPQTHHLFYGFNYWTWLVILVYVINGLCIEQIIKYFSNVVNLFINAFSILLAGCLTWSIFGLNWTVSYLIGLILVVIAVLLHKSLKKCIVVEF